MRHICIVDDDESLRTTLAIFFELLGAIECITAGGLADLRRKKISLAEIDAAILDVNLGEEQPDGLEVYHWMNANGFRGRVVFISGHARWHPKIDAIRAIPGVQYLEKPMDLEALETAIGEAA